jgi:hypothetical protein
MNRDVTANIIRPSALGMDVRRGRAADGRTKSS